MQGFVDADGKYPYLEQISKVSAREVDEIRIVLDDLAKVKKNILN